MLEKTLESPLDCKEIQPIHSKDQSWVFIGRTDAKAETPILWPPDVKSWLIGKDSDAGRDWRQEEKGTTGDEMAGWHHRLNANEFGWTPGVGDGQGGLACCNSWGLKESDMTKQLNWNWTEVTVGKSLCSITDHNTWNQKNYGLNPGFYPSCFSFLPLGESFMDSSAFEAGIAVCGSSTCDGGCTSNCMFSRVNFRLKKSNIYKLHIICNHIHS